MKTFKDLEFKQHPIAGNFCPDATQAKMEFANGYGISVITGAMFYTDLNHPFEVAVLKGHSLCYSTPITDDVIGHCNQRKVTEIMKKKQQLH